jgi:hypothetical protein
MVLPGALSVRAACALIPTSLTGLEQLMQKDLAAFIALL